ncbi:hypothetical protein BDR26DRAFT_908937 [Obelidium mucronatum]|nr:hypothetical protein BDR26DRAFT_908937 [Obelidium mucronatum]
MDWDCPACFNINWAKRATCNQCNAPKPGTGPDQEREGRGGGFKERDDVVEYKNTRFESDDEYDDFGRKKKKGKKIETAKVEKPKADDNEDEEDDGEDDGKWDAWNDILGDDAPGKKDDDAPGKKDDLAGRGSREGRESEPRGNSPKRRDDDRNGERSDYDRRRDNTDYRRREDVDSRDRFRRNDHDSRDRRRDDYSSRGSYDNRRNGDYGRRQERSRSPRRDDRRDNYRR